MYCARILTTFSPLAVYIYLGANFQLFQCLTPALFSPEIIGPFRHFHRCIITGGFWEGWVPALLCGLAVCGQGPCPPSMPAHIPQWMRPHIPRARPTRHGHHTPRHNKTTRVCNFGLPGAFHGPRWPPTHPPSTSALRL